MNRQRLYGGSLLAVAAVLAGPAAGRAQSTDVLTTPPSMVARGQLYVGAEDTTYQVPGLPAENVPIPTGNPGTHGFYTAADFVFLTQSRPIGAQTVAFRGLIDSRGVISGLPGTIIGPHTEALNTNQFPRQSYLPGYNITVGYKLDDGTSIYMSYLATADVKYHTGATLVPPFFAGPHDLSATFLTAPVYNFPPQYAGPLVKTVPDDTNSNGTADPGEGGNFYGIWNGASVMDIEFTSRFVQSEIGVRVPLLQTEYSRIYGLAGGRYDWIFERFRWRTVSFDISGQAGNRDSAEYNNTLSQRMYGIYFGCGHEVYLGKRFSLSLDLTGAGLVNVIKERAKYELSSREIQNKLSRDEYSVVPSGTAALNLWWYPIEGVQVRAGYSAITLFDTRYMGEPIGFNYSSIDPAYDVKAFRLIHGFNVGVGLFF